MLQFYVIHACIHTLQHSTETAYFWLQQHLCFYCEYKNALEKFGASVPEAEGKPVVDGVGVDKPPSKLADGIESRAKHRGGRT